jgi:hypothetical protein
LGDYGNCQDNPTNQSTTATQSSAYSLQADGTPTLNTHRRNLTKQLYNEYQRARRKYYKHNPNAKPRHREDLRHKDNEIIEKDPAINRYFTSIKSRPRNNGYLSPNTKTRALNAVRNFLIHLKIPLNETALTELINRKKENQNDFSIDDSLEEFSNLPSIKTHRNFGVFILGIFKANRARLQAQVNCHFPSNTQPISEGILRSIRASLDERKQDLIDLQAFAGQRIRALSKIPISQIDISKNEKYALLHIFSFQNKSKQDHFCIVPRGLIEKILKRCKDLNLDTPFPNYEQLWREITHIALEKHGVRLTSHYLRKRFATIASDTPMDVNQWDYLMGAKKSKGHDASAYNLNFLDRTIENYDKYLVRKLTIDSDHRNDDPLTLSNEDGLLQLIKQQQETINRLTELISKSQPKTNQES